MNAAMTTQSKRAMDAREANRKFYDIAAKVYERVDGRRPQEAPNWLRAELEKIKREAPEGPLLEIGCGAGWLLKAAEDLFPVRYGCDLSPEILAIAKNRSRGVSASGAESLCFKDGSVAVAAFFATLHHLPEWRPPIEEAARILKPGGVIYCDHDIESEFINRHRTLVKAWRGIRKPWDKYRQAEPKLTEELYRSAEWHEDEGVSAARIREILEKTGFEKINMTFHWMGISPLTDAIGRLLGESSRPGAAPLLRVTARKKEF